jgi:hypothetical protein
MTTTPPRPRILREQEAQKRARAAALAASPAWLAIKAGLPPLVAGDRYAAEK